MHIRPRFLCGAAACALAAWGSMALAQTAPAGSPPVKAGETAAQGTEVEQVIVNARRRSESIQNTPVAVTAINAAMIQKLFVYDLTDLNHQAPNVQIEGVGAIHRNAAVIFSRGIGYGNVDQGQDPAVGVSVDGVFYARNIGALADIMDVNQVEILRGPQGTLFGRNTIGGVVNITTNKASTEEWEAQGNVRVGNLGRLDYGAILNVPVSDTFAFRIAARSQYQDGPYHNTFPGPIVSLPGGPPTKSDNRLGGFDVQTIRPSFHWQPIAPLTFDLSYTYIHDRSPSVGGQNGSVPTDLLSFAFGQPGFGSPGGPTDPYAIKRDFPSGDYQDTHQVTLNTRYRTPWFDVASVTGYIYNNNYSYNDYDDTALPFLQTGFQLHQWQFSQEIRFSSNNNGPLQWVAGGYFFTQRYDAAQHFDLPILSPMAPLQDDLAVGHGWTYAGFAQVDYHVTRQFELSAGLRYTSDKKNLYRVLQHPVGTPQVAILNPDGSIPSETSDDVTFHVGADYHFTPDLMAYAKYDTGFVGGGFNTRSNLAATIGPFLPEKAYATEIGLKSDWFEHRLRANLAAFWNSYSDLQVGTFIQIQGVDGEQQIVANNAFERARGVELEVSAAPVDHLRINASAGYLDAAYTSFTADLTGSPFYLNGQVNPCGGLINHADKNGPCYIKPAYSPNWTAHVDASYDFGLNEFGTLTPDVQVNYESKHYTDIFNLPVGTQPGFALVNASLNWEDRSGRYKVSLWVKNMFDKRYIISDVPTASLFTQLYFADPRTYGIDLTVYFTKPR